jgi:hypothetical protein
VVGNMERRRDAEMKSLNERIEELKKEKLYSEVDYEVNLARLNELYLLEEQYQAELKRLEKEMQYNETDADNSYDKGKIEILKTILGEKK